MFGNFLNMSLRGGEESVLTGKRLCENARNSISGGDTYLESKSIWASVSQDI